MLGIIGGTGLDQLAGLEAGRAITVRTPYGDPSGPLTAGKLRGRDVVFVARHGAAHAIAPHEVNYRANIWALHGHGVRSVAAVATVGGITPRFEPGALAVPDQIIDYTHGRSATFFDGGRSVVHVDFTRPYCESMRARLLRAADAAGESVIDGATYAATQGPRLETAAEITRLERDGSDVVGMTGMPEAVLARELGLCYAALAVVVNHAAGRGASAREVPLAEIHAVAEAAMTRVRQILERLVETDGD